MSDDPKKLPFAPTELAVPVVKDKDEPEPTTPTTLRPGQIDASRARQEWIVVVDDDHDIRETFAEILRDEGYQVRVAEDGVDALDKILRTSVPPDLVLLDYSLPYLSGEGVQAALDTTRLSGIPVVIITAGNIENLPPRLRLEQVFGKPFNEEKLKHLLTVVRARISEWRNRPRLPF